MFSRIFSYFSSSTCEIDSKTKTNTSSHVESQSSVHTDLSNSSLSPHEVSSAPLLFSKWGGRTSLPVPMFSRHDFSVWSILKQCIGKELSKITMPVIFNEPLSFLQRLAEYMEYANLLNKANLSDDPVERMQYVVAFAISACASNWERIGKPFNPLLGETYELSRPDKGFRIICEQVSHHPPISAFHADSEHFRFHGSIHPKLKFWGKSVEIQPKGVVTVELLRHNEAYTWTNVNCCVHNIIVGKLWIEQYGVMEIINHRTGHKAVLNFKPSGWFSKDLHRVEGYIYDREKRKLCSIYGKWTDFLNCVDVPIFEEYIKARKAQENQDKEEKVADSVQFTLQGSNGHDVNHCQEGVSGMSLEDKRIGSSSSLHLPGSIHLWQVDPRPENSSQYYSFTSFAMMLNELNEDLRQKLSPTDCRQRPDIVRLENGDIDGAAEEKNRLEEKQREARKDRKKRKLSWTPRWFIQGINPYTNNQDWLYLGGYWERNFTNCPDIFWCKKH